MDRELLARGSRSRTSGPSVDGFLALLGALAMGHIVLPAYSPTSKGSVERNNGYLETSFLPLRSFSDLADLQGQHDAWAEQVAFSRHLRRLGGRVRRPWSWNAPSLPPCPIRCPMPTAASRCVPRATALRAWPASTTRCRPGYALRRLQARLSQHELAIFCEGRLVARHKRSYVPCDVVRDAEHMAALAAAQEAQKRLTHREPELPVVDLARYDALVGAPL